MATWLGRSFGSLILVSWIVAISIAASPSKGRVLGSDDLVGITGGTAEDCKDTADSADSCGFCYDISNGGGTAQRCDAHYNETCVLTVIPGCIACDFNYQQCPGDMQDYVYFPGDEDKCVFNKPGTAVPCQRLYGDANQVECTSSTSCGN